MCPINVLAPCARRILRLLACWFLICAIRISPIWSRQWQDELYARGYSTLIGTSAETVERQDAFIGNLLGQRIDGAIVVPQGVDSPGVQSLIKRNLPLIGVRGSACAGRRIGAVCGFQSVYGHSRGGRGIGTFGTPLRGICVASLPDFRVVQRQRTRDCIPCGCVGYAYRG